MKTIEHLDKELLALQKRHDAAMQEIGRLEAKLQTRQFDFQSENEVLSSEVVI